MWLQPIWREAERTARAAALRRDGGGPWLGALSLSGPRVCVYVRASLLAVS